MLLFIIVTIALGFSSVPKELGVDVAKPFVSEVADGRQLRPDDDVHGPEAQRVQRR